MQEITPSDYTVFVNNIPQDFNYEKGIENELKNFFETEFSTDYNLQVSNINLIYEIEDVITLRAERAQMIIKKKSELKKFDVINQEYN